MTDKEIIKAFECCINSGCNRAKCPRFDREINKHFCKLKLYRQVNDLINHQKAEIERYERENESQFDKWKLLDERTKKRYAELYEEAKGVVRVEAIKEFADRLNKEFSDMEPQIPEDRKTVRDEEVKNLMSWILHDITKEVIDSVVKEMVGE